MPAARWSTHTEAVKVATFSTTGCAHTLMLLDGYKGLTQIQAAYGGGAMLSARPAPRPAAPSRDSFVMGLVWVTTAMALFAGLAAFARASMTAGVPALEVVFLRNLFATVALSPLLLTRGRDLFQSPHLPLYGVRCLVSIVSMTAWFYAISVIPIGEVTAISFLAPLFGTLAAVLLLGEVVRARRWTALLVGFCGALIILRPGGTAFGLGQACAVISAIGGGFVAILVKQLTSRDDPTRIVFLTNALLVPLSLIPALFVWVWPSAAALPFLLGMGCCAVLGHLTLTRAFAAMDASLVLTFEFSRLPFTVGLAYLAFGETIDLWTWVGAAIIFSSAVYISRREAALRRAAPQPPAPNAG